MKPILGLKVGQQLTITPQLQQAIRLLQLSSAELQTEISTQLQTNVLLEVPEEDTRLEDEDLPDTLASLTDWGRPQQERTSDPIETLNATSLSLRDYLFWQMQLTPFTNTDRLIAASIIDAINDDGFLTCTLKDLSATLQPNVIVELDEIEAVLHRIQQFDPLGVGARSLEECLSIQMKHVPLSTPWHHQAQLLITHYLLLLGKHNYSALQQRLKLNANELQEVIQLIQTLHPCPGSQITHTVPEYIIPDAFVFKHQGTWVVKLNHRALPHVTINQQYAAIVRDRATKHPLLKQQLQEAKWLLRGIETRNDTLLRVIRSIVARQTAFLEYGEAHLTPLILQEIADDVGMHGSTISRITTRKFLHTPGGIIELKRFLSPPINKHVENGPSATAVRAKIRTLVANEGSKPLSDNKIVALLAADGVAVARRTVTKYREEMHILPSHQRKRLR